MTSPRSLGISGGELALEPGSQDSLPDDASHVLSAAPTLLCKAEHLCTPSLLWIPGVHPCLLWVTLEELITLGSSGSRPHALTGPTFSRAFIADPGAVQSFSLVVRTQPLRPFLSLDSALNSRDFPKASSPSSSWSLAR